MLLAVLNGVICSLVISPSDSPLAKGFLITDGHVGITVPNVPDGDYFIVCECFMPVAPGAKMFEVLMDFPRLSSVRRLRQHQSSVQDLEEPALDDTV